MDTNFKAQKADVARLLSWLLTKPDEEMVEALRNREIHRLFSDYFKSIHGSIPSLEGFLPQHDQPNLLHLMREDYRRLFQDSTTSDLCWVESVTSYGTASIGSKRYFPRVYIGMGTYIPHREGIIQTIVRNSLTQYQAYASPSQTMLDRLEQFTGCADWSKGVARIRCEDCGHSYFRPFSCKVFHLCPSCDQKRTLLYAEYLAEDLLLDLPHRKFVFTLPKILRPYFKSDKRLCGDGSRLIFSLLSEFFALAAGQELLCACVVSYQSFGEFARFHPHWHVLVLEGGFTRFDRFVYVPIGAYEGMLKVWKAAMLSLFQRKKLIDQE